MLEPGGPQLARPLFEAFDQPTRLSALARKRLDSADLGRDLGEWARRIRIQLRQPPFGAVELRLGGSRPAVGLVGQRPQLTLGRRLAADHLAKASVKFEIEVLGKATHLDGAETARSRRLATS